MIDLNLKPSRQLKESYGEETGEVRFPTEEWKVLVMIHDSRIYSNGFNA